MVSKNQTSYQKLKLGIKSDTLKSFVNFGNQKWFLAINIDTQEKMWFLGIKEILGSQKLYYVIKTDTWV